MQVNLSEDNIKVIIGSLNVREIQMMDKIKDYEKRLEALQNFDDAEQSLRIGLEMELAEKYLKRIRTAQRAIAETGVYI